MEPVGVTRLKAEVGAWASQALGELDELRADHLGDMRAWPAADRHRVAQIGKLLMRIDARCRPDEPAELDLDAERDTWAIASGRS